MGEAKRKFEKTIKRCYQLNLLNQKIETKNNDLSRASIVLSVAALDAYVTDCFSEHFLKYIKKKDISREVIDLLDKYGVTVKCLLDIIKDGNDIEHNVFELIREKMYLYFEKYTTQKMDVIDSLFSLYGLKDITLCAQNRSNEIKLLEEVNKIIIRRHGIVHNGDYDKNFNIKTISNNVINDINKIEIFVDNMDYIIENRFSKF